MNNENGGTYGFLEVTVLSGINISPIPDASVSIFLLDDDETYLVTSGVTDNSGSIGPIKLESLDDNYNSPSGGKKLIKTYILEVVKDGFYKSIKNNVPIFPDIVSREYVNMIPRADEFGIQVNNQNDTVFTSEREFNYPGGEESGA